MNQGYGSTTAAAASELQKYSDSEVIVPTLKTLCEKLLGFLHQKNDFLFPSALASAFLVNSSVVVLDKAVRNVLLACITSLDTVHELKNNPAACNIVVTNIIMNFGKKLLAHILRLLGKGVNSDYVPLENRYAATYQSVVSLDFKQNMHYIGGSNIKSILRTALRVKHRNEEWKRVMAVIKNNFLISEFAKAPEPELLAWTDKLDRGKLIEISAKALDFFVQLGVEVKPLERLDGSLINEEDIEKITVS